MNRTNFRKTAAHPPARHRARVVYRGADFGVGSGPPDPYPELGPEIVTRHLWLVESAVAFHGTDVDAISAAVCLPPWNVRRSLHTLGLGPVPTANPKHDRTVRGRPSRLAEKVAAWLADRGTPATSDQIADGCAVTCRETVTAVLKRHPERFRRAGSVPGRSILWTVRRAAA